MEEYKILLVVQGSTKGGVIILADAATGKKGVEISIGTTEFERFALGYCGHKTERLVVYDVMLEMMERFYFRLTHVTLTELENNIYYALIALVNEESQEVLTLDCRFSDALNLAVRTDVPIFVSKNVPTFKIVELKIVKVEVRESLADLRRRIRRTKPQEFGKFSL